MERAITYFLKAYFEEYVSGLDNIDTTKFPVTLSDLKLNEKKIQEDMRDSAGEGCPFEFLDGVVRSVQLQPSFWEGKLHVVLGGVVLNFSFSATKAMKKAFMPVNDGETDLQNQVPLDIQQSLANFVPPQPQPPQREENVPPRFCTRHGTSEQREKAEPRLVDCEACHSKLHTNYVEFRICPACSRREARCMYCGDAAADAPAEAPARTRGLASRPHAPHGRAVPPPPPAPQMAPGSGAPHFPAAAEVFGTSPSGRSRRLPPLEPHLPDPPPPLAQPRARSLPPHQGPHGPPPGHEPGLGTPGAGHALPPPLPLGREGAQDPGRPPVALRDAEMSGTGRARGVAGRRAEGCGTRDGEDGRTCPSDTDGLMDFLRILDLRRCSSVTRSPQAPLPKRLPEM